MSLLLPPGALISLGLPHPQSIPPIAMITIQVMNTARLILTSLCSTSHVEELFFLERALIPKTVLD
jgi:hypothetical protein